MKMLRRAWASFVEREYARLFLTPWCPTCRANIDKAHVRRAVPLGRGVVELRCGACPS